MYPGHFGSIRIFKTQRIGSGSYGMVCRAECDALPCAAKLLHPVFFQSGDPGAYSTAERFEQECRFLSSVRHPNIVQYLGTCQENETRLPVLLMELMDESLTQFLERSQEPLPYHTQVDLSHDIALALAYLHSRGIVHRDLSSNNVLIAGNRAKVTDFGMSKLIDSNPRMTPLTQCPGTLAYMAPEALLDPPRYTKSLDIFSHGVVTVQIISRLFPNPAARLILVDDVRSPTGKIPLPVPEVKRRKSDIDPINPAHPLLAIALGCLKDSDEHRPKSADLCQQLTGLKETPWYYSSQQESQFGSRGHCHAMSVQIQELTQQKTAKENEIHRLQEQIESIRVDMVDREQQLLQSRQQVQYWYNSCNREASQVAMLQGEVQKLRSDVQMQLGKVGRLQQQVESRDADLREKEGRIVQITREVAELKDQLADKEVEEVEAQQKLLLQQREVQALRSTVQGMQEGGRAVIQQVSNRDCKIEILGRRFQVHWSPCTPPPRSFPLTSGCSVVKGNTLYISELHGCYVYTFDTTLNLWSTLPLCPQENFSLAVVENLLTVVGGQEVKSQKALGRLCSFAESHSSNSGEWTQAFPPMLTERLWPAVLCAGSSLVVAGGRTRIDGELLNTVEVLNTKVFQWYPVSGLPKPLCHVTLSLVGDDFYVAGGSDADGPSSLVFVGSLTALIQSSRKQPFANPLSPSIWKIIADVPLVGSAFVVIGDCLLSIGGEARSNVEVHPSVCVYNCEMNSWDTVGGMKLPHTRSSNILACVVDNRLVVAGESNIKTSSHVISCCNLVAMATLTLI